jgi:hypothetical protein
VALPASTTPVTRDRPTSIVVSGTKVPVDGSRTSRSIVVAFAVPVPTSTISSPLPGLSERGRVAGQAGGDDGRRRTGRECARRTQEDGHDGGDRGRDRA